ncbi:MAG: TIGR01777 family oxidoreductase [Verrucomicrobia bacterium]|nr:TIGR01777 family oxidoreductase [Verrucomicrobiota bacterium]
MPKHEFRAQTLIKSCLPETLWRYHSVPGMVQRLTPPWERTCVEFTPETLTEGSVARLRIKKAGIWLSWHARHEDVQPGSGFADRQTKGPFAYWRHEHLFAGNGKDSWLQDTVRFKLPFEPFTRPAKQWVLQQLEAMFAYRHRITAMDIEREHTLFGGPATTKLRVAITGMTGMLGSSLATYLRWRGHEVIGITRNKKDGWIQWNPDAAELDPEQLEGLDAVIHLAGENLADGRWTETRKRSILQSRTRSTQLLVTTLANLKRRPSIFISASGIHAGGTGFPAEVCDAWEKASDGLDRIGIRRVILRFGAILQPSGGALAKMLPAFRMGLGGSIGGGQQRMPWIALEDAVEVTTLALERHDFQGALEVVAPQSINQAAFAKALAKSLRRPAIFPLPAMVVRVLFGEMGEAMVLSDISATPVKLLSRNYRFRWPKIEPFLHHVLGR